MTSFVDPVALVAGGPRGLTRAAERMLWHLAFDDVRVVDGRQDNGADVLAVRERQQWVVQTKWSSRGAIDRAGVDDCERAKVHYGADHCVLVTNTTLNRTGEQRRRTLEEVGIRVAVWNGATLTRLFDEMPSDVPTRPVPREYQHSAIDRLHSDLVASSRGLLILATGLGKTVVGGEVIRRLIEENPRLTVLVVAHTKELVEQLERAFWKHLPKTVPTQLCTGDHRPRSVDEGVTFATVDSALGLTASGYRPDAVMVDETHHVGRQGMYATLLDRCDGARQFGVTATPWRGDKFDIADRFGAPSFTLGIEEGMRLGYLAHVDYQLFVDNLDWDLVRSSSKHGYSIKDLNARLFLPQRDQTIVDELRRLWLRVRDPRALVFCQTIEHANQMAELLRRSDPVWRRAVALHDEVPRQQRQIALNAFRLGRAPILTSVDVFNEGVDVPDVNIIAFLRVTHSRRIFVQQLGRGLRLREGKDTLHVLDFVSDVRRIAAALRLRRALSPRDHESLELSGGHRIEFSDAAAGSLLEEWVKDAASLETAADDVRLQFPDVVASLD